MKLFSPHDPPEHKPCSPLDYPATLRDIIQSEARIISAINGLAGSIGNTTKILELTAELKAHADELQKSIDAAKPPGQ
jgi:hypothetical protein